MTKLYFTCQPGKQPGKHLYILLIFYGFSLNQTHQQYFVRSFLFGLFNWVVKMAFTIMHQTLFFTACNFCHNSSNPFFSLLVWGNVGIKLKEILLVTVIRRKKLLWIILHDNPSSSSSKVHKVKSIYIRCSCSITFIHIMFITWPHILQWKQMLVTNLSELYIH